MLIAFNAVASVPIYFVLGWGGVVGLNLFALAFTWLGWRIYLWMRQRYPGL